MAPEVVCGGRDLGVRVIGGSRVPGGGGGGCAGDGSGWGVGGVLMAVLVMVVMVLEVMMMAAVAVVCLGSGGDRGQHRRHGRLCATWDAYARKLIEIYS